MKKIKAEIVADSINSQGDRITTYLLTFPRFILAELNTHRVFSKNSASSRAIPFMWHTVLLTGTEFKNFFDLRCPQYEYYDMLTGNQQFFKSKKDWLQYYNNKPLPKAKHISKIPENDIEWLQINKGQAEIHMQALAEAMWDAMNESTPKLLKAGEWHIPFSDNMDEDKIETLLHGPYRASYVRKEGDVQQAKIEIAIARCARLSYMTFDGEIDYEKDLKLYDTLLKSHHMSPFEHCARAMSDEEYLTNIKGKIDADEYQLDNEDGFPNYVNPTGISIENSVSGWCNNFRGFIQYRHLIENNYEQ